MDYRKTGEDIVRFVGGKENIQSIAHCATRLRIVLADDSKADKASIVGLDGVKGAFVNAGQFQVIIGQGAVNKVYDEIVRANGIMETSLSDQKNEAAKKLNWFQRFARVLSNIFVPVIPVIVASGLLMGVLGLLKNYQLISPESGIYILLDMFSSTAFVFLPVLIAFSAAKQFGGNPYLAAALGAIMIHPTLQNAWTLGSGITTYADIFGYQLPLVGYQGTVLPVLLAVWLMSFLEKKIRKIMPNALDLLLTPFFTLLISGAATFFIIGPVGRWIGDGISLGLLFLFQHLGALAGVIFGGTYSAIVITGVHHSFHAVEAGLLANPDIGVNFLLPVWSMANVAQGGAALAVYFKSKNKKTKAIAAPASLSCLLGVTEAAIFGINLPMIRPFIAAAIGGAVAGGFVVFTNVVMTGIGVTGFPGAAIVTPDKILLYLLGMLIAFAVSFIATLLLGFQEPAETGENNG